MNRGTPLPSCQKFACKYLFLNSICSDFCPAGSSLHRDWMDQSPSCSAHSSRLPCSHSSQSPPPLCPPVAVQKGTEKLCTLALVGCSHQTALQLWGKAPTTMASTEDACWQWCVSSRVDKRLVLYIRLATIFAHLSCMLWRMLWLPPVSRQLVGICTTLPPDSTPQQSHVLMCGGAIKALNLESFPTCWECIPFWQVALFTGIMFLALARASASLNRYEPVSCQTCSFDFSQIFYGSFLRMMEICKIAKCKTLPDLTIPLQGLVRICQRLAMMLHCSEHQFLFRPPWWICIIVIGFYISIILCISSCHVFIYIFIAIYVMRTCHSIFIST